jgi:hypothetical protein
MELFHALVIAHATIGALGLVLFWVPVVARKGGASHRRYGLWFARSMMITGVIATTIACVSLTIPLETHKDFTDAVLARGLFGWMMLYLAALTFALGWQALASVRNKARHHRNRNPADVAIQLVLLAASVQCLWQGLVLGQPLMIGISVIGLISVPMALGFAAWPNPPRVVYLLEHVRTGVGAGISAYTAFLSVGLVRAMPEHAFNPLIWAIPGVFGIGLILWHWRRLLVSARPARTGGASGSDPGVQRAQA